MINLAIDRHRQAFVHGRSMARASVGADAGSPPPAGTLDSAVDQTTNTFWTIVKLAGVGVIIYWTLGYALPLFFGSATKAKKAHHEYRRVGHEDRQADIDRAYSRASRHGRSPATIDAEFIEEPHYLARY